MLGTLVRRITINALDTVVERGRSAEATPVRWAASALDTVRAKVGLTEIARESPLPAWTGDHPHRPMWESDRKKLHKHRIDQGIISPDGDSKAGESAAAAPSLDAPIKVFYKRGCPYARAALDLLRERDLAFEAQDIKGDDATLSWLKIVTGKKVTPQIFIRGEAIGGYDELRALDASGELLRRVQPEAPQEVEEASDEISAADLLERLADKVPVRVLDVREASEVSSGVIEGAMHIPLASLSERAADLDKTAVWIAYCHAGVRSMTAVERLRAAGFRSVVSLRGGIMAWRAAGGPVAKLAGPKKLPVLQVHPEKSPFEGWAADDDAGAAEVLEGDALVQRVREVLDECRPMVQADGGDIELMDVQSNVVHLQLTGNCVGCPSSQATLRQGIERRLKARIPQITGISSPQLQ